MGQVIAWPGRRPPERAPELRSVVYFVRIGKFVKVGVTTKPEALAARVKELAAQSVYMQRLFCEILRRQLARCLRPDQGN